MFGLLCEGSNRITCEPCDSYDQLAVVNIDCFGEDIEKVLCQHCKELVINKEDFAW